MDTEGRSPPRRPSWSDRSASDRPAAPGQSQVDAKDTQSPATTEPATTERAPRPTTVNEYVGRLDGWQAEVAARLRAIVRRAAPEATETYKWSQPVYEDHGPFCYFQAHGTTVNLGFWRGTEVEDSRGLLSGTGRKMRHVKIASVDEVDEDAFATMVKSAVRLNRELGNPALG